jgi:GNAT superfamily N-acetyltransferase
MVQPQAKPMNTVVGYPAAGSAQSTPGGSGDGVRAHSVALSASKDCSLLATMNQELIRDEGHRNAMNLDELKARMQDWLDRGEYEAVVFTHEDEVVGYALFCEEPEHVHLRQFFIRHAWRRRGLGRAAFVGLCAEYWAGARLRLDVLVGNAAGIAFWRALGFETYCLTLERPQE